MAIALRPRFSPSSMTSRYGSQLLTDRLLFSALLGYEIGLERRSEEPESGVTSLAGFGKWEAVTASLTGFASPASVVTSLASFAGSPRPRPPPGRTKIPPAVR